MTSCPISHPSKSYFLLKKYPNPPCFSYSLDSPDQSLSSVLVSACVSPTFNIVSSQNDSVKNLSQILFRTGQELVQTVLGLHGLEAPT